MLKIKRVYDAPAPDDGRRYLIDRLWPRGLTKAELSLDGWLKDLSPSTELRQWFGHEPAKWDEFKRRYAQELESRQVGGLLERLRDEAASETVTLLFAAKDQEHNHALVLRDFIKGA
ncbi:MAG: DUF488 domain-containing protein [Acidobacteriota bacterium]